MSDLALHTLLRAIQHTREGDTITADSWRMQAETAGLRASEIGPAMRRARGLGYLRGTARVAVSATPSRRAGSNRVWLRTGVRIPDHVCEVA